MTLSRGSRIKIFVAGAIALVFAVVTVVKDVRDYRRAGSKPGEMTVAQAREASAATPFVRRWIRITEPLQIDCKQALQQSENDKVTAIVILAFDQSRQQPFLLDYPRDAENCQQLRDIPMEGMLIQPEVKYWTTQGMKVPTTQYPMMGLRVGQTPKTLLNEAEVLSGVAAIMIGLLCFAYVSGPKKQTISPEKAFAKAAAGNTSRQ